MLDKNSDTFPVVFLICSLLFVPLNLDTKKNAYAKLSSDILQPPFVSSYIKIFPPLAV